MTTAPIPRYPVITVDVRFDGSAHVNVAGRHIDYPAAPIAETRAAVTLYSVELAQTMARPVRMTITDPQGAWKLAAHPDGTVTELAEAAVKPMRRRKAPFKQSAVAALIEQGAPTPVAPLLQPVLRPAPAAPRTASAPLVHRGDALEPTELAQCAVPPSLVSLTFGTDEVVVLRGSALVGRRPARPDRGSVDQLVTVTDESRTVSKTHFRIDWHDRALWITDQSSGNGTSVDRANASTQELEPWEPAELHHGDVVHIGDLTFTVAIQRQGGARSGS